MRCLSPVNIHAGDKRVSFGDGCLVPCGKCRNCMIDRKQAWAGKLMAEVATSAAVWFVTLTYKEDSPETAIFRYEDIQRMLKSFRKAMAKKRVRVRFFCAGEQGGKYGRVHWHCLFFFNKFVVVPTIEKNTHWEFWSHGWTQIAKVAIGPAAIRNVRYVVKYVVKGLTDEGSSRMSVSLKPALGHDFFVSLGKKTAAQGLAPSGFYSFDGITFSRGALKGHVVKFPWDQTSGRYYMKGYEEQWKAMNGADSVSVWNEVGDRFYQPSKDEKSFHILLEYEEVVRKIKLLQRPKLDNFDYEVADNVRPLPREDQNYEEPLGWLFVRVGKSAAVVNAYANYVATLTEEQGNVLNLSTDKWGVYEHCRPAITAFLEEKWGEWQDKVYAMSLRMIENAEKRQAVQEDYADFQKRWRKLSAAC